MQPLSGRFVVLRHELPAGSGRRSHWDLMLEVEGTLWTWELLEPLAVDAPQTARRLPDHRLEYLLLEGPVSGGRGTVKRAASGCFAGVWDFFSGTLSALLVGPPSGALELRRRDDDSNPAAAEADLWELFMRPVEE